MKTFKQLLNELRPDTMASYAWRARDDLEKREKSSDWLKTWGKKDWDAEMRNRRKMGNRNIGISRAIKKLAKDRIESTDPLCKDAEYSRDRGPGAFETPQELARREQEAERARRRKGHRSDSAKYGGANSITNALYHGKQKRWSVGEGKDDEVFTGPRMNSSEKAASHNFAVGPRPLSVIAREIRKDWKKVYFGAVPYLDAMSSLDSINDQYYQDSAKSVVAYFLSNATLWRGDVARRVKKELNDMLKSAKGRW